MTGGLGNLAVIFLVILSERSDSFRVQTISRISPDLPYAVIAAACRERLTAGSDGI